MDRIRRRTASSRTVGSSSPAFTFAGPPVPAVVTHTSSASLASTAPVAVVNVATAELHALDNLSTCYWA
jgi:hypothetical protein